MYTYGTCVCEWGPVHATVHVQRSKDNWWKSILPFHYGFLESNNTGRQACTPHACTHRVIFQPPYLSFTQRVGLLELTRSLKRPLYFLYLCKKWNWLSTSELKSQHSHHASDKRNHNPSRCVCRGKWWSQLVADVIALHPNVYILPWNTIDLIFPSSLVAL